MSRSALVISVFRQRGAAWEVSESLPAALVRSKTPHKLSGDFECPKLIRRLGLQLKPGIRCEALDYLDARRHTDASRHSDPSQVSS